MAYTLLSLGKKASEVFRAKGDLLSVPFSWGANVKTNYPATNLCDAFKQQLADSSWEVEITPTDVSQRSPLRRGLDDKVLKRTEFDIRLSSQDFSEEVNLGLLVRPSVTSDFTRVTVVYPNGDEDDYSVGDRNNWTVLARDETFRRTYGQSKKVAQSILRQYQII